MTAANQKIEAKKPQSSSAGKAKIETDMPLSEKDEVKKAEDRTIKSTQKGTK
jgi:hypothetical protein